jgi:hypothetical protein
MNGKRGSTAHYRRLFLANLADPIRIRRQMGAASVRLCDKFALRARVECNANDRYLTFMACLDNPDAGQQAVESSPTAFAAGEPFNSVFGKMAQRARTLSAQTACFAACAKKASHQDGGVDAMDLKSGLAEGDRW